MYLASFLATAGEYRFRTETLKLLEMSRAELDPVLIARVEVLKAHLAKAEGRPGETITFFQRAAELFEQAGNSRAAAEARGNVAISLLDLGQLEEAEAQARKLWSTVERAGLDHMLGGTFYLLANILAYRGELDEAREFVARTIAWTTRNGERYFLTYARLYGSVIEHSAGDFQAAEKHALVAFEMVQDNKGLRPFARALLARAAFGQNRLADATLLARSAYKELEDQGNVQDGEPTICLAHAECLIAISDMTGATDVLRKAVAKLRKRAEDISLAEWRVSFLERIPEHRSLMELAQTLGIRD
jgi:tetratricopeptide (TPR) repeat protein